MSRHRMTDDAMSSSPMKFRVEPFLWLAFSGGGVMAAIFLPVLVLLFALAFPLGWIDPPDHAHLAAVVGHPITFLVLLGIFVMILVHAAHRFRYTLYDGLQIKHRFLVGAICYGGAFFGTFVALHMLGSAT
jgi:fumarate reductase subunit D